MLEKRIKAILGIRIIAGAWAFAWLLPLGVAFLPWSVCEGVIVEYGFERSFEPILRYWFAMAGVLSGFVGIGFGWLMVRPEKLMALAWGGAVFHVFLGGVLLIRGIFWEAPLFIVGYDCFFCFVSGGVMIGLLLIDGRKKRE